MKDDDGKPRKLDADTRNQVIDAAIAALRQDYVVAKAVGRIEKRLRDHQKAKRYDALSHPDKFAKQLNDHLQEAAEDKQLELEYSAGRLAEDRELDAPLSPREKTDMRSHAGGFNGFFSRAERLAGNIGYVRIDALVHPRVAAGPAAAALSFVADTDELILDLRGCGGTHSETAALVVSYLVDAGELIHVSTLQWRGSDQPREFWTSVDVAGRRYPDKPVHVLTSSSTAGAGEDLAHALRALKRAKLYGEVTAGFGQPRRRRRLTPNFALFVPSGRITSAITRSSWEGRGVRPHVEVEAADALDAAYLAALQAQRKRSRPKLADWVPDLDEEIDQALKKAARKA
jgi:retinol-binding protein 3